MKKKNRRVPDAALAHERFGKAAVGQVAEHRSSETVRIELRRAIEDIRGRSVLMHPATVDGAPLRARAG